jgi:hypothetical protein
MPAVIDTPEVVEHEEHALYDEHDLYEEQPPVREAHPGFWHRVQQYVKRHRVHTPHGTPSSTHGPLHGIDTPEDLLARQYPALSIRPYAGI